MNELRQAAVRLGALLALGAPLVLHAGDDRLDEIIVTAPMHKGEAETVHPSSVISGSELRRRIASTLGDTLKEEQGVSFSSFGPGVGQPVLRGQGAPRVLVLQNSMSVADASNTSGDHANATEPVLAERIEVLRGPATLLYGSGAIGGVVNVIDNRVPREVPRQTSGAAEYRYGSNAELGVAAARLETGADKLALHLDGFTRHGSDVEIPGNSASDGSGTSGYIANSETDASSATAGMAWMLDRGFAGLAVNRLENDYGIPPGSHGHEGHADEDVRIDMSQTRYDGRIEIGDPLRGVELLRTYLTYTDYQHDELEGEEVGTQYGADTWDGRLEAVHRLGDRLHGALGLQGHQREFRAVGEEAFVPSSDSESWGIFLIEDLHLGRVVWEFGARYNRDGHDPRGGQESLDFDTYSLSASGLWSPDDRQTLKLALSSAERAPTTEELYSDGVHVATRSYEIGDQQLDPERSLNVDLGYHLHAGAMDLVLEAFYNEYERYIYQEETGAVFDPDSETIAASCLAADPDECLQVLQWTAADARFRGAEARLALELAAGFELQFFGDYVRGELDGGGSVPRMPPGRYGTGLAWRGGAWDLSTRITRVLGQDRMGGSTESVDGYTLLAAYAEYAVSGYGAEWTFFLRGENLLDEEIRNASSLLRDVAPEPGLNVEAGVRLAF